jgi:hypothetical protein
MINVVYFINLMQITKLFDSLHLEQKIKLLYRNAKKLS